MDDKRAAFFLTGGCRSLTGGAAAECRQAWVMPGLPVGGGAEKLLEKLGFEGEYFLDPLDGESTVGGAARDMSYCLLPEGRGHVMPGVGGGDICLWPFRDGKVTERGDELRLLAVQMADSLRRGLELMNCAAVIPERPDASPLCEKLTRRAANIAAREIHKKGGAGRRRERYMEAMTAGGYIRLYDTADALAERVFDLRDPAGLARPMLELLADRAVGGGYEVYACLEPMTGRLIHVIVPELSLAFVTSDSRGEYLGEPYRRVRLDSLLSGGERKRLKASLRTACAASDMAAAHLKKALACRRKIEDICAEYIDKRLLARQLDERARLCAMFAQ